jgi:hypothetical protein
MTKLDLTDFETGLLTVKNSKVIPKYIEYVTDYGKLTGAQKYKTCNENNVADYFCEILKKKTSMKNLKPSGIMKLITDMNDTAQDELWGTSQREWAINKLCDLAGKAHINKKEVKDTRSWFTPSGIPLTTATMKSTIAVGNKYEIRNYNDSGASSILNSSFSSKINDKDPTEDEQKKFSQTISPYTSLPKITSIKRKVCATCWICKRPIHVYNIIGPGFNNMVSCGQDEHVLPPGWGNIVGVLWGNLADQLKYNINSDYSLAPSHAWCNQLKNDELFIKLPYFDSKNKYIQFSINKKGIERFKAKGIDWLTPPKISRVDHDMFFIKRGGLTREDFMDDLEKNIRSHMTKLIDDINSNLGNTGGKNYTTFLLRTTLCLSYIWVKYVRSNSKTILGGQKGGANFLKLRNVELDSVNDDLLASTIYKYDNEENDTTSTDEYNIGKLEVNKIYETFNKFDDNEASIICDIDNLVEKTNYSEVMESMSEATEIGATLSWEKYIKDQESNNFENNMGSLGFIVGQIICGAYLSPERVTQVPSTDEESEKFWKFAEKNRGKLEKRYEHLVTADNDIAIRDELAKIELKKTSPETLSGIGKEYSMISKLREQRSIRAAKAAAAAAATAAAEEAEEEAAKEAKAAKEAEEAKAAAATAAAAEAEEEAAKEAKAAKEAEEAKAAAEKIERMRRYELMGKTGVEGSLFGFGFGGSARISKGNEAIAQKFDKKRGVITINHKSRKHKSRKHKSRKHKSRKHKSRKHKSRKNKRLKKYT